MTVLIVLVSALVVVLALLTTGWFLLMLPFSVPAAFGAWLGRSNEDLLA